MSLCRQQTNQLCQRQSDWPCMGCGKPVCRVHRFFSELGGYRRSEGIRVWHHLCATCFALEQSMRKTTDEITAEERAAFLETPTGQRLRGDWDRRVEWDPIALREQPPTNAGGGPRGQR